MKSEQFHKANNLQIHCLIFDLTFSRLPVTYRKSRRQQQEICFMLVLYVFAKMSPSFPLWKETSSPPTVALLDFTAFKWAQVFIAPTWQILAACKYTEKVHLQQQGNPPYTAAEMWALQQNIHRLIFKHIGDFTKEITIGVSSWRLGGTLKGWKQYIVTPKLFTWMDFWKGSLPLLFLPKWTSSRERWDALAQAHQWQNRENSGLWLTARFISSTADSLFTKWRVDSSRPVSTWTHVIPAPAFYISSQFEQIQC